MADTSARLNLPLLAPGQAQKELYHNEALALIDLAVQASVVAVGLDAPPAGPSLGQCWIVGPAPTADWTGRSGSLAGWTGGGWRFVAAVEGMAAWDVSSGQVVRHVGGGWVTGTVAAARLVVAGVQVVGPQRPAIAAPAAGATIDAQARDTLAAILAALRSHGLIAS